jgi:hypothetical protein
LTTDFNVVKGKKECVSYFDHSCYDLQCFGCIECPIRGNCRSLCEFCRGGGGGGGGDNLTGVLNTGKTARTRS